MVETLVVDRGRDRRTTWEQALKLDRGYGDVRTECVMIVRE